MITGGMLGLLGAGAGVTTLGEETLGGETTLGGEYLGVGETRTAGGGVR